MLIVKIFTRKKNYYLFFIGLFALFDSTIY